MDIKHEHRAVGVFPNRLETESALLEIKSSGFPMDNVSVVGRNADTEDKVAGVEIHKNIDNKADEGAVAGAVTSVFLHEKSKRQISTEAVSLLSIKFV